MRKYIFVSLLIIFGFGTALADDTGGRGYDNRNDYLVHSDEARDIMGGNFYGQRELEEIFQTRLPTREIDNLYYVPFLRSTLERCRDCILFYYSKRFGLKSWNSNIRSFLDSRIFWIKKLFASNRRTAWYSNQKFANQSFSSGWHLIRTGIDGDVASILNGTYRLGPREKIAPAGIYIYAMLLSPNSFIDMSIMTSSETDQNNNIVVINRERIQGRIVIDTLLIRSNTGWAVEIKHDRSTGRTRRNIR
jgi:hypothetical protein